MNARALAAFATASVLLTGCSGGSGESVGPATDPSSPSTSPGGTQSGSTPSAEADIVLTCGTPSDALVDRAKSAMARHPGPVTATTMVFAAETATGKWFVVGLDRAYVHDDGSLAGGGSRDLGLVLADGEPESATVIGVATDSHDGNEPTSISEDWSNVSWTGEVLDQGKAAVAKAVECLDAQGTGD